MEIVGNSFAQVYGELLNQLMYQSEYQSSPRGQQTREITDITLIIKDPTKCIYRNKKRSSQLKYIAAELVWYFAGDRSIKYIDRYAKFWKNIAKVEVPFDIKNYPELAEKNKNLSNLSATIHNLFDTYRFKTGEKFDLSKFEEYEKAKTQLSINYEILNKEYSELLNEKIKEFSDNNAVVNSAYGDLIFKRKNKFDYSQYHWAYESLASDKDTRQAIMHFNTPDQQYLDNKDFVCTLSGIFMIRNDKLNFTINMRSNDAILGTPTDVAFFCTLQRHMLYHLKPIYPELELGTYKHKVHSMHVYEKHFELIEKMLENTFKNDTLPSIEKSFVNIDGSPTDITKNLFEWADNDLRESIVLGQDNFVKFITNNLTTDEQEKN